MQKITVRANPKCRYCLGDGRASTRYAGVTILCSCVSEQLRVIVVDKNYRIPAQDRYVPGQAEFVKE
jgi:hypothetical protein